MFAQNPRASLLSPSCPSAHLPLRPRAHRHAREPSLTLEHHVSPPFSNLESRLFSILPLQPLLSSQDPLFSLALEPRHAFTARRKLRDIVNRSSPLHATLLAPLRTPVPCMPCFSASTILPIFAAITWHACLSRFEDRPSPLFGCTCARQVLGETKSTFSFFFCRWGRRLSDALARTPVRCAAIVHFESADLAGDGGVLIEGR